jgi:rhodanese-related sulfurtransferase
MSLTSCQICTTNAQRQVQDGALLVDVRELGDVRVLAFDAPEVFNLPLSELEQRWQELPRDRELVTVCQTGEQSQIASQLLLSKGLTRVSPMRGGIVLRMQKGYPVIGRRFTPFDDAQGSVQQFDFGNETLRGSEGKM